MIQGTQKKRTRRCMAGNKAPVKCTKEGTDSGAWGKKDKESTRLRKFGLKKFVMVHFGLSADPLQPIFVQTNGGGGLPISSGCRDELILGGHEGRRLRGAGRGLGGPNKKRPFRRSSFSDRYRTSTGPALTNTRTLPHSWWPCPVASPTHGAGPLPVAGGGGGGGCSPTVRLLAGSVRTP